VALRILPTWTHFLKSAITDAKQDLTCTVGPYIMEEAGVQLGRFRHKGLRQLYEEDNAKSVPAETADKLRKTLFALETADELDQVARFPGWRLHPLKGDLKGFWSLTVSGNWRLVFRYDEAANLAGDLDLIDYH